MVGEQETPQARIHRYAQTCELLFEQPLSYYRQQIEKQFVTEIDFSRYYVMITGLPRQVYRPFFGTDAFAYSEKFRQIEIEIVKMLENLGVRCMTTMLLYDHTKRFCMIFNKPDDVSETDVAKMAAGCFDELYARIFDMSKTPYRNYTVVSAEMHGYENLPATYREMSELSRQQFFDSQTTIVTKRLLEGMCVEADREQIHEDLTQLHIALRTGDGESVSEHFGRIMEQIRLERGFELLTDVLQDIRAALTGTMRSHGREMTPQERELFALSRYPTMEHMAREIEAFLRCCAAHFGRSNVMSAPIQEAVRYIRHHYAEDVSLDMVAQYVGMSTSWVSRRFSQECGCSIPQYLLDVRIERAKQLLIETDMHVFEVAQAVGMENSRYFGSLFRKETGMTPKAYREQNKKEQLEP